MASPMLPEKEGVPWLWDNTVFLTMHGSCAYGTNIATSDLDLRGFCIPPKNFYLGFMGNYEQTEFKEPMDIVVFGIRKFFKLATECNPNVIEILFTDPKDHLIVKDSGKKVLEHKRLFLTKRTQYSFGGYAMGQLTKINNQQIATGKYDTKDAMHLVRLLRMCKEIGETGEVNVKRKDREELLAIRSGEWKFEDVIKYAEDIDKQLKDIYAKSPLPERPELDTLHKLNELLVDITEYELGYT